MAADVVAAAELRAQARNMGMPGASSMSKEELTRKLERSATR